jgi:8-hydroxy-5-deazaflavin:NADPH oxidoreductase
MKKTFGIIGAGNIGQTVARHLLKAGYTITLSNGKAPETLKATVDALGKGVTAGTAAEAALADIVLLSLPWSEIGTLTPLINWQGKIVIDATNHFITFAPEFKTADLGDLASSEVVAGMIPGAHLVKAFNTIYFKILAGNPHEGNGRRVLFISGNYKAAKETVAQVIEEIGFAAIDLGDLHTGSKLQQAKGPLATLNLLKVG